MFSYEDNRHTCETWEFIFSSLQNKTDAQLRLHCQISLSSWWWRWGVLDFSLTFSWAPSLWWSWCMFGAVSSVGAGTPLSSCNNSFRRTITPRVSQIGKTKTARVYLIGKSLWVTTTRQYSQFFIRKLSICSKSETSRWKMLTEN